MAKIKKLTVFLVCFLVPVALISQQMQTGTIRGKITDAEGSGLPGVNITVTSPSLIGTFNALTNVDGDFRAPGLPPGTYLLTAELSGFKTIRREGVIVHVGMVVTIDLTMEISSIAEEVRVVAASPVVDVQSTKVTTTVTTQILENLPSSRDFTLMLNMLPGVVGTRSGLIRGSSAMHGAGGTSHAVDVDGVSVNDPAMHEVFTDVQFDTIEEIEVISGGLPAQVGNTSGGFVNIVTKSGGNEFHGNLQSYFTNKSLVSIPIPDYQIVSMNVGKPTFPISDFSVSANIGGAILKDKLWFYTSGSYRKVVEQGQYAPKVILGKRYDTYDMETMQMEGYAKLTTQLAKNMRLFVVFIGVDREQPYARTSQTVAGEAVEGYYFYRYAGSGNLSWVLGQNAILDFRSGFAALDYPIPFQKGSEDNPRYYDRYTGYVWGSASYASRIFRFVSNTTLQLTAFKDDFLGGNHEFKAGIEAKTGSDRWDWWRGGNQIQEWSFYNENRYYYRGLYNLSGPHPTYGDGRLTFYPSGSQEQDTWVKATGLNLAAFVQDAWSIKDRLTLNLGLRIDTFAGDLPESTKKASSDLATSIGEYYFAPKYGINPFAAMTVPRWKNPIKPVSISPRIGLSYDVFGNKKTALKASYSIYHEEVLVSFYESLHPFYPRTFTFDWWDLNNNGVPDVAPVDKYNPQPADVRGYSEAFYRSKIDKDMKAPKWREAIISIQHELVQNFSIGLKYMNKVLTDEAAPLLYDLNSNKYLFKYDLASEYWAAFTTIVPKIGDFAEQSVTLYYPKKNHPDWFTVLSNVPDASMKYQALEFTFDKRMTRGWQLGGSVVVSKAFGSIGNSRYAFNYGEVTPNYWVGRPGRISVDRPFAAKAYGTFQFPLDFVASFFYVYESGAPFGRTATIYPPASWAAANNVTSVGYSVLVQPVGTGRIQSYSNLDIRLEKRFNLNKYGTIGLFADVLNLLGNRIVYVGDDPSGTWRPTGVNSNVGTYTPTYYYGKVRGIEGARILKLSVRYSF